MSIARAATRFATASSTRRAFAVGARNKHTLPDLPYDYNALEPAVSGQIMELHHSKHHQTYVNALNAAEEQLDAAIAAKDLKKQIQLQSAINFNGGGHLNHSLFWEGLKPEKQGGGDIANGGVSSSQSSASATSLVLKGTYAGSLAEAIKAKWGDLDALKKDVNAAAAGIQGSGWAWVGLDPKTKELVIATTANQDPLVSAVPLFGIDMWEHAFYLQHQNRKPDYLANIWRVINFDAANKRYEAAKK